MADYMEVNDMNNSGYLSEDQVRRFEIAKKLATDEGLTFLSPKWLEAWSHYFGIL